MRKLGSRPRRTSAAGMESEIRRLQATGINADNLEEGPELAVPPSPRSDQRNNYRHHQADNGSDNLDISFNYNQLITFQNRQAFFQFLLPLPANGNVAHNGCGPQDLAGVVFDQGDGELQGDAGPVLP